MALNVGAVLWPSGLVERNPHSPQSCGFLSDDARELAHMQCARGTRKEPDDADSGVKLKQEDRASEAVC